MDEGQHQYWLGRLRKLWWECLFMGILSLLMLCMTVAVSYVMYLEERFILFGITLWCSMILLGTTVGFAYFNVLAARYIDQWHNS